MQIIGLSTFFVTFTILCRASNLTKYLQDCGTYPVNWNDNVLIFYVTLKNDGNTSKTASVKMIECCEQFLTKFDINCNHMILDGSQMVIERHSITNCSLLYVNAYPYNRKGNCRINVSVCNNQNETVEYKEIIQVPFDTTIRVEDINLLQENMLDVEKKFKLCEFPDEDPLNLCEPVNCHWKYQGFKSLFDSNKRQCVSIPACSGELNKKSSDMVYDPFKNKCVDKTKNLSITDIDNILHGTQNNDVKWKKKKSYYSNLRCHHGNIDHMNKTCVCDDGWDSALNWSFSFVSTVPIHMCTVKVLCGYRYYKYLPKLETFDYTNIVSFTQYCSCVCQ